MENTIKKGDRVIIVPTGETGTVETILGNGAIIERDSDEERRFTPITFVNLRKIK